MEPLISVIIPVYKVEKYLVRCVDSVINQTYRNLEIILVDDGSLDNCPVICDEYAKKDSRVRVIHKENGGLSDARNAGLDIAKGEYIAFLDSDDYVAVDAFEVLLKEIKTASADLCVCSYKTVDENNNELVEKLIDCPLKNGICSCEDIMHKITKSKKEWFWTTAWNKLYSRHIFDDLRFPKGKYFEDNLIAHEVYARCKRIVITDKTLYFYCIRDGSIAHSRFQIKHMDSAEAYMKRIEFAINNKYYFLINSAEDLCFKTFIMGYMSLSINTKENKERFNELYTEYQRIYPQIKKYCDMDWKKQLKRFLFFRCNALLRLIIKIVK